MFINKNKNQHPGSFEVKRKDKFFRKKYLLLALLFFIFGTAGYYAFISEDKPTVSSAVVSTDVELPGWWLQPYFGASICSEDRCQPQSDPDGDKLTNSQEFFYHTNPLLSDTNKNGMDDGEDVANNFDPSKPGKVTFDELESDEGILGESLVFDQDVKRIISEMTDSTQIKLPEVKNEEIIVSNDNSKEAKAEYVKKSDEIANRYFNFDVEKVLTEAAQTGDDDQITELKIRALKLSGDLKALPVPPDFVQLHKYYIVQSLLIPKVITIPGAESVDSTDTAAEDMWYDNAQAYMVLLQKIFLEEKRISHLP